MAWQWAWVNRALLGPPTFAQVVGTHEAGLGGPGPDPLPGLVLSAPEAAKQDVTLTLVLQALPVGVVTSPRACRQEDKAVTHSITEGVWPAGSSKGWGWASQA